MGLSVKLVYTAGVRTGVHMFAICVKTGIIFKMRNTLCPPRREISEGIEARVP